MPVSDEDFESQDDETTESENSDEDSQESQGGAASKGESDESTDNDETARRLQSERDKERARANKAEAELKKLKATSAKGQEQAPQAPAEVQEWIVAARDNMKRSLFAENPKFSQYGIDPNLIVGDTPAEMRASAKSLSDFVENLHGQVRSAVLQEHGYDPEPRASEAPGRKDFAKMDPKEFNALVDEAMRG